MTSAALATGVKLDGDTFLLPQPFTPSKPITTAHFGDWLQSIHTKLTKNIIAINNLLINIKIAMEILYHDGICAPGNLRGPKKKITVAATKLPFMATPLGRYTYEDGKHFLEDVAAFYTALDGDLNTPNTSFPFSRCLKIWIARGQSAKEWKFFIRCARGGGSAPPQISTDKLLKLGVQLAVDIKMGRVNLIDEDLPEKSLYLKGLDLSPYNIPCGKP